MLIPKRYVLEAMNLDAVGVNQALRNGGYSDDDIVSAVYLGMSITGNFVYEIYPNGVDPNKIYIRIKPQDGEYVFIGLLWW